MAATYDEALARLTQLQVEFQGGEQKKINEDTTRLRFVDALLLECLDWDRFSQVETEIRTDVGICDYVFSLDVPLLIVEAKRTGISFELPIEPDRNVRPIKSVQTVLSLDKEVAAALAQAAAYALEKGSPFAAVTNGWQLVAFCTQLTPGVSWRKGRALVLEDLTAIRQHFKLFWNALSVEGVRQFALRKMLAEEVPSAPGPRRSATIANFDRSKNRNDFQADLQILGDLVFGGRIFEDRKLFHEHCYCAGGALPQFSKASRSYLEDRYPDFFAATAQTPSLEQAQTKKGPAAALTNLTNIRKPILLLGDVGVGKTTFLEHLFLVDWADQKESLVVLRIDLADKPSRPDDLPTIVASEIERSLLNNYDIDITEDKFLRGVYHSELARFRKSPQGAVAQLDEAAFSRAEVDYLAKLCSAFDEHIRAVFAHLVRGRSKMVVVIFDNVDQRSPDLQKATFIQAQIAASTWDVFVMLALRPETYVRAKLDGEIAGYHPRAFTVSPPRFDQLIGKRLETAIKMLRGELPVPTIGGGATVQIQGVADYLEVLQHSFEREPELLSFCEDISGGNMRLALDYVVAFMSCGHVDARKILERWRSEKRYTIPLHEFARGVMFANREYYSGRAAAIANVFDCQSGDSRETFGILVVLSMTSGAMRDADKNAEAAGYISIEELKRNLLLAGYRYDQASWLLERALECRLVETNLKSGDAGQATHVRISPTGAYYFQKLVRTFVYADAVCVDTPICDQPSYEQITDVVGIPPRLTRAEAFVGYLDRTFNGFAPLAPVLAWELIAQDIRSDIARVRDSNDRAIARRTAEGAPPSVPPRSRNT